MPRGAQYENMTHPDQMEAVVADVKAFLGLDPAEGRSDIRRSNTREHHLQAKGQLAKGEKVLGPGRGRAGLGRAMRAK